MGAEIFGERDQMGFLALAAFEPVGPAVQGYADLTHDTPRCVLPRSAQPRHGRHQVLERHHHRFEPAGHLARWRSSGGCTAAFFSASSLSRSASSRSRSSVRKRTCSLSSTAWSRLRKAAQESLELIDRGVEPLRGLLQSVRLTHRAALPARRHVSQPVHSSWTGRLCNVVTAPTMLQQLCLLFGSIRFSAD